MKLYRQGDLLFKEVAAIPPGGTRRKSGHILEGEATGHTHRIAEPHLDSSDLLDLGEGLFLAVNAQAGISIVHEEHTALQLPPGNYEIVRQREYTPVEIRDVVD